MEPREKRRDVFRFIRTTMHWAVMYPMHLDVLFPRHLRFVGTLIEWTIELFLYLVAIHIAILYVCTLYLNLHSGDLELLVNCMMQTIIYIWIIIMKVYFRRIRPHLLEDIVDSINSQYQARSAIGFTYVSMDNCIAMSNRWIKAYLCFCFTGSTLWLIQPMTNGDRSLPLTCWYPIDNKQPVVYEFIYFLQSVAQIQVAAAFSASSGFHMVLSILISGQYDILFCSLKNIQATVAVRMKSTEDELRKLLNMHECGDPEVNEYYCSKEKSCTVNTLVQYTELFRNRQDFRHNFRHAFGQCIEHHQQILAYLRKMEKFYSPIWFFKTGEVIFLMCLVAFVSVKSTTANSSLMKTVSLGQYLFLVGLELLIICYFGEIIYYNSQRCGEAVLRSPWYHHMREMKNDFLIFLVNSNRPFRLTAGKMYNLDLNIFRCVLTTAFSFLTLLQEVDERD